MQAQMELWSRPVGRVEWECDLDEHRGVNLDSERECTAVRVMP